MMSMRRAGVPLVFSLAVAATGCGGGNATDAVDATDTDVTDADDLPVVDAAPRPDGIPGDIFSLTWGPLDVDPGEEDTRCVTLELSNDTEIKVRAMRNQLGNSSHHLIVYRDNSGDPLNATPTPCQAFAGTLNPSGMSGPIMITQRADESLLLPNDVAYTFAPHQHIKLEMHFINTSEQVQTLSAQTDFTSVDPTTVSQEADFLFIGSPDIQLPACSAQDESCPPQTVEAFFNPPPSLDDLNIFAITGHTHHLGRDMQVATRATAAADPVPVYAPDNFSWSEPETVSHSPTFPIPSGAGGFQFSCEYKNTTNAEVTFGEKASNEMCFFWAYYYPSVGAKVCIHTDQFAGGIDVCCPDAGPQICDNLIQQ